MIVVDGRETPIDMSQFQNLEQIIIKVMEDKYMADRVVTDVLVNKESFSEIYPHQAEDIPAAEVQTVEFVTMGVGEMAVNITRELYKVVNIMETGARKISGLFRQADDAEALDMFQDLIDVTRDFFSMVAVLRDEFSLKENKPLATSIEELSNLFSEMLEVTGNEDWVLLADLLEYEYIPAVQRWKQIIAKLREDIRDVQ